ncbi:recombinase family protein [Eubacteriaceae bacterium ES2]|nr:recombinase family protein [Eubacteriaceae bacterium ES2]
MKRAGIYIRVSTEEQVENYSIPAQTDRLINFCKAKDYTVVKKYVDPGHSGGSLERPAIQELINDVKQSMLDFVIVYKLDRISRSQKDTLYLIEDVFTPNGVAFISMNESFDTSTAFGRAMIGILSVFAQLEREQIKERTAMGRLERAKAGLFHGGGNSPIGYDFVDGNLIINEYEAIQVREIYDLFVKKHLPVSRIQKMMRSKYTNRYGSWHSNSAIASVLLSPVYAGIIEFKGIEYEGQHEAIVSKKTFEASKKYYYSHARKEGLSGNASSRNPFKATQLLTGIIWCGDCGARYYTKRNTAKGNNPPRSYYTCYSRGKSNKSMIVDPDCRNKSWYVGNLDKLVIDELRKISLDSSQFRNDDPQPIIQFDTEKRIREIDKQLNKLIDLYQISAVPIEEITKRTEALEREKNVLLENSKDQSEKQLSKSEAKAILKNLDSVFATGTIEDKRSMISMLIEKIEIYGEEIRITWTF